MLKRKAYLLHDEEIELGRKGLKIWGYDPKGKYVCRLEINAAGIAVYKGKKGGKRVVNVTWEKLINQLSK